MTAAHPKAVGSYGPELLEWSRDKFGMHPKRTTGHRWWQEFVVTVLLQHDDAGDLCFRTALLGTARQSGKSWTLRELAMWRTEQAERFGEVQTVVHAAAKLSQAVGVWSPAARWAERHPIAPTGAAAPGLWDLPTAAAGPGGWKVRTANGSEAISRRDGSAWVPQAANDQLGVSLSVSLAIVDEAWDVPRWIVDNGLVPTQAEASSGQLLLVSTAGQPRTGEISDLYPSYRVEALAELDAPASTLILEWSADPDADPGDPETWRQASPHWDDRRRTLLEQEWRKAQTSPQAMAAFRLQWLNQWPDSQDAARWIPSRVTAAADRAVGDPPHLAECAIEASYSDPGLYAVALAWPAGPGIHARVYPAASLTEALHLADGRRVWAHRAVVESIGPRHWLTDVMTVDRARAATGALKTILTNGRLGAAGVPDSQWQAAATTPSEGGELLDGKKSTADIHHIKALSWAVWAVESGRSHSGILFGAPPDDAQPGAQTA